MRLLNALAALLACTPVAAWAQGSSTNCARNPSYFGCLPPAPVVSRSHTLPLAAGDTAQSVSIDQILKQLNASDVTTALGYTPGTGSGGSSAPLTAAEIAGALSYTPVAPMALAPVSAAASSAQAAATTAASTAATAQTTATNAATTATTAQTTAATASTTATAAQTAATAAAAQAASAQAAAQNAASVAASAQTAATLASTAAASALAAHTTSPVSAVTVDTYGGMCLTLPSGQVIPSTAACGYVPPSASALLTAGASPPGLVLTVDPVMPTQTATLATAAAGVSGIQLDSSGDVLALNDPISGAQFVHGYGEVALLPSGSGGRSYFHSGVTSVNNSYDAITIPLALGAPVFAPVGQAFTIYMVVRENCTGSPLEYFRAYSAAGVHLNVFQTSVSDGAFSFGQNNGAANGVETPSAASACGQWEVVEFSSNGTQFSIYRNGVRTAQTAAATGAGQVTGFMGAPTTLEFLNDCQCDFGGAELLNGGLSIAEDNTETARLGALFSITVSAVTVGNSAHIAIVPIDHTQEFLTTPNFPTSDNLPTVSSPVLHAGLTLTAGAVSKAHVDFTPSGNITNRAALDAAFYYNPISGNQNVVIGNPQDGNSGSTFSVFRRYPAGHTYDLHTFGTNGLTLGAYCSQNNTSPGCYDGGIYSGMIRAPTNVLPGDIVEWGFRKGNSVRNWTPGWLFGGYQHTPGPGGNPFGNFGQANAYLQSPNCYHEFDEIDGWHQTPITMGRQLNYGAVAGYEYAANVGGQCFVTAPHETYDANGANFKFDPGVGSYPHEETLSGGAMAPWNDGNQHYFAIQLRGDGSHLVDHFFDGKLYATQYYEYADQQFTDPVSGGVNHIGMHFRIDNTAVSTFTGDSGGTITPQDGSPGSWNVTVSGFDIIHGSISNLASSSVTTDANGTNNQALNGLTNFVVPTPLTPGSGVHWANLAGTGALTGTAPYASIPTSFPQIVTTPYTTALHATAGQTIEMTATITQNAADIGRQTAIMGAWGGSECCSLVFLVGAGGNLIAATSDGTHYNIGTSSVSAGLTAGTTAKVDALINIGTGAITFYTFPGGVKTQLGTVQTGTANVVPQTSQQPLLVIGNTSDSANQAYGTISQATIAINGTVVANPVFGASGTTDTAGLTWTASPGVVFQ